ncbi:hypothetical protein ACFYM7_35755 [Streptomyces cyaneofuscatus]|uniref:hypothetical protein n=1 Tax=Streptomyces cyaneofuscatus TaxID=66883 RepID=UPI0036B0A0E8
MAVRALVLEGRLCRGRTTVCDSASIEAAARADLLARTHRHGRPDPGHGQALLPAERPRRSLAPPEQARVDVP